MEKHNCRSLGTKHLFNIRIAKIPTNITNNNIYCNIQEIFVSNNKLYQRRKFKFYLLIYFLF